MAQAGYTPIQLYFSTTAAAVPVNTNLVNGELALNIQDEKLYFKNAAGTVKLLAGATSGPAGGSNTQVQFNSSGALAGSANLTFSGTTLTLQNGYYEAYDPADTTSAGYGMRFYTNGGGTKTENGRLVVSQSGTGSALSSMIFQTNSGSSLAEQMRLTSTGLCIGTTSATAKLTVINTADANKQVVFGDNATYYGSVGHNSGNGLNEYRTEPSGGHGFFIGTSGTANLLINSSGNVGIGTSSPSVKLDVNGTNGIGRFNSSDANGVYVTFANNGTAKGYIGSAINVITSGSANDFAIQAVNNFVFATGGASERMRIDSTGNVGIGTSSPSTSLTVSGANTSARGQVSVIGASSADARITLYRNATLSGAISCTSTQMYIDAVEAVPLAFYTSDTQRAQISAAGGFSVGTTSDPGAGAIYATGNITAFFSDKRLKTVSGKIENALDKVAKLSGVYYTFNDTAKSFGYDSDEEQVGVIAQEVEAVLPQIVKAAPFDLDENNNSKSGENYKTVQYDKLVPLLIEAINELQAKVKALEAK